MIFQRGDKVTLTEAMKTAVRDPNRFRTGVVAGASNSGIVEVLWNNKPYAVCMRESEIEKLHDKVQMTLF